MTLRLVVDRSAWSTHVRRVASELHPLVPVVKGNGYGFGQQVLAREASRLQADVIAVGTIHEALTSATATTARTTWRSR